MGFGISLVLAGCGAPAPYSSQSIQELERSGIRAADPRPLLAKTEWTLEDVLEIAERLNPDLASERRNPDLAAAVLWDAGLYPNPSFVVGGDDFRPAQGGTKWTAGVRFPVIVGGRLGAASALSEREREAAAWQFVTRRREILADVKRAFVSVLAANRSLELAAETREIAKRLHEITQGRFDAQMVPEMELLKAAVNFSKAETDFRRAQRDQAVAVKALQVLMGDADLAVEKVSGALFVQFPVQSLESLRGPVIAGHPALEAVKRKREAAEIELDLAKAERIPDLGLELVGGRDVDGDMIVEGGIEIPLPLFNRNQGKIAAAEIRIRKAELQIQAVRNELLLRLTEAYRNFTTAQETVTTYEASILPKAGRALEQTHDGYKLGKLGYLDLLDAQRTLADAKIAYAEAAKELNLAAVDLEKLTGMRLEPIR